MVRRVLQHLLTRLGDLARDADNADALLECAERASALFGRAVAGHLDPVSPRPLGGRLPAAAWWLAITTLDAVAHVRRARLGRLPRECRDAGRRWTGGRPLSQRDRPHAAELADYDGDVDRAVAPLRG